MKLNLGDVLGGCRSAQPQSVGRMQVIPLVADDQDDRLAPPTMVSFSTTDYGTVAFRNDGDTTVLVPSHLALLVPQAAQDHTVANAALVEAGATSAQRTAMCIQESQSGLIRAGRYRLAVLPASLREPASRLPKEGGLDRLWPAVATFNGSAGVGGPSDLVAFTTRFGRELARFVAEFECLDDQVGAVVLLDGDVVGVERAPSRTYWQALWEPLIRFCYGSEAVRRQAAGITGPPATRVGLGGDGVTTLSALAAAISEADAAERDAATDRVTTVGRERLHGRAGQSVDGMRVAAVEGKGFLGSVAFSDDEVRYGSLVARAPEEEALSPSG